MIAYLNGILAEKDIAKVVVECGGVGYEAAIPVSTFDRLPAEGEQVKLYTHHEVREDAQLLFGFGTKQERDMFRLVTTVSGVGPKLALAVLSGMTVGDLQLAVSQGDSKRLATVKGIGRKTASRLAYHVMRMEEAEAMEFAAEIKTVAADDGLDDDEKIQKVREALFG